MNRLEAYFGLVPPQNFVNRVPFGKSRFDNFSERMSSDNKIVTLTVKHPEVIDSEPFKDTISCYLVRGFEVQIDLGIWYREEPRAWHIDSPNVKPNFNPQSTAIKTLKILLPNGCSRSLSPTTGSFAENVFKLDGILFSSCVDRDVDHLTDTIHLIVSLRKFTQEKEKAVPGFLSDKDSDVVTPQDKIEIKKIGNAEAGLPKDLIKEIDKLLYKNKLVRFQKPDPPFGDVIVGVELKKQGGSNNIAMQISPPSDIEDAIVYMPLILYFIDDGRTVRIDMKDLRGDDAEGYLEIYRKRSTNEVKLYISDFIEDAYHPLLKELIGNLIANGNEITLDINEGHPGTNNVGFSKFVGEISDKFGMSIDFKVEKSSKGKPLIHLLQEE